MRQSQLRNNQQPGGAHTRFADGLFDEGEEFLLRPLLLYAAHFPLGIRREKSAHERPIRSAESRLCAGIRSYPSARLRHRPKLPHLGNSNGLEPGTQQDGGGWPDYGVQASSFYAPIISLAVTGGNAFSAGGGNAPTLENTGPNLSLYDDVNVVHGRHQFAFGGFYRHTMNFSHSGQNSTGTMSFNGRPSEKIRPNLRESALARKHNAFLYDIL